MNKLILVVAVCLSLGCQPAHHWQIHNVATCYSVVGDHITLHSGETVLVIAHQANGKSRVIYKDQQIICPTENVWAK